MAKKIDTGFGIAHLLVPNKLDITLEMSFQDKDGNPLLEKRIKEINSELRFKHKVTNPEWAIRRVGEAQGTWTSSS
jgi:hypothetical protein